MSSSLSKFNSWLLRKLSMVLVVAMAGFATYGFWLYVQDEGRYENGRAEIAVQREQSRLRVAALEKEGAALDAGIAEQQRRVAMAGRVIETLKALDSTWDRFIWKREQQRANDEQAARMQVIRKAAEAELVRLRHDRLANREALGDAQESLARADRALADQTHGKAVKRHYLGEAWYQGRWYVVMLVGAYLLGPTIVLIAFYYGMAPFVARGRPMRLSAAQTAAATVNAGMSAVETDVWPGEVLWVKKAFLGSGTEGLMRKTRWLLSWRFPFSSVAGGLFNLAEVRNVRNAGGRRIGLSGAAKWPVEFTVVEVPEGGSLVARPGFLAGVLSPAGQRLVIRRHWRFFRWQAWTAGQFRFFEFVGPCRLILVKRGTLRAEQLVERPEVAMPAARVRQMSVVAFTPNMECRPVRAVSFWRYYIGATQLFEAGFSGAGLVVHATRAGAKEGTCGIRRRALKLFGL